MNYRKLGNTGINVSEISLGTWQVGGGWGQPFDHNNAAKLLNDAADKGINFIDTADVYDDGLSEQAVGKFVQSRSEKIYVGTKCGRRFQPHTNDMYTPEALRKFVEDSLRNTGLEQLDLIQLHCPPTEVYYRPEIFEVFDRLKTEGKIAHLGVSVEKVEEGLKAMEYDNVRTIQLIFNMFRQRPADLLFRQAALREVGLIVRVPLASGLLTGKFTASSTFEEGDHRSFNRNGEVFDRGETFAGIPFQKGLEAVEKLKALFPGQPLASIALRWILMYEEVSCVIPGASRPEQLHDNVQAAELPPLTAEQTEGVRKLYEELIKPEVHHFW